MNRFLFSLLLLPATALGQNFAQQGPKLVGTGAMGNARQGHSVCLSADGNTAIVGGDTDNSGAGAAWVWTRSGGVWTQGPKLVGSDAIISINGSHQGNSVSLSADGNTAIVGASNDTGTWVWTRIGGVWVQQGNKLVPSGGTSSFTSQGSAVSLSADGNTAIIGDPNDGDSSFTGAARVWTRNAGVWTQQGPKLIGSGAVGILNIQGISVALSADGNTAIVGGAGDMLNTGAAWVWTRSGDVWAQQGPKLVGSGAVGANQGWSVALSADGNTAIVGSLDNSSETTPDNTGEAWIWTRSGGVWTQQGPKLVGPGGDNAVTVQGFSVSLSADGNTAIVGGVSGNSQTSTVLVWTRSGGVWTQQGAKLAGSGAVGIGNAQQPGVSVSLSADGKTAIVGGWNDNSGAGAAWVFAASEPFTFFISGQVTSGGTALSGVTVALTGGPGGIRITDGSGNYSFTSLPPGVNYTVAPSHSNYFFIPPSTPFNNLQSNQTANFTAIALTNTISGQVTLGGAGLSGVTVTLSGGSGSTRTSDGSGNYLFTGLSTPFSYTVTPSHPNYNFTPANAAFSNLQSNQTANFTATSVNYSISGQVTKGGAALDGVTMTLAGGPGGTLTTNTFLGNYSFPLSPAGRNYTLTPTLANYTFTPLSATFNNLHSNQTANFIGIAKPGAGLPDKVGTTYSGYSVLDANGNFAWDGTSTDKLISWSTFQAGEKPIYGDWNGDGKMKAGVYNNGTWLLDYNGNGVWDGTTVDKAIFWSTGQSTDVPVMGDWNGDGKTKIGIYNNGTWILDYNGNGVWEGPGVDKTIYWSTGQAGEVPAAGDWNGDGKTKIGIYSNGTWILEYNGNYAWDGTGVDKLIYFGGPGYMPMMGDWNGSGWTKIGAYNVSGTWAIDYNGNFVWDGTSIDRLTFFGGPDWLPVVGDWSGSGTTKIGAYTGGQWALDYNGNFGWDPPIDRLFSFGAPGQTPIVGKW